MPDLVIGQQGKLKSMPKLTRINGDDALALIYRNMGNNHAYPFVWSETVTVASGETNVTVISGVKFHGMEAATYCNAVATPLSDPGARFWVEKNTSANTIKVVVGSSVADAVEFDVMVMVGIDPDVAAIACRGNTGAAQSLP